MEMVLKLEKVRMHIPEIGSEEKEKDSELVFIQMATNMLANLKMTSNMDLALKHGVMEESTMVAGTTKNNMVLDTSQIKMVSNETVNGKMEKE